MSTSLYLDSLGTSKRACPSFYTFLVTFWDQSNLITVKGKRARHVRQRKNGHFLYTKVFIASRRFIGGVDFGWHCTRFGGLGSNLERFSVTCAPTFSENDHWLCQSHTFRLDPICVCSPLMYVRIHLWSSYLAQAVRLWNVKFQHTAWVLFLSLSYCSEKPSFPFPHDRPSSFSSLALKGHLWGTFPTLLFGEGQIE